MNNQNTIGFLKSHKKYERRIALLPQELSKLTDPNSIYLEKNHIFMSMEVLWNPFFVLPQWRQITGVY